MYPAAYRGVVAAMRAVTPPTGWLVSVFQDAPSTFPGVNVPQGLKSVLFIDLYGLMLIATLSVSPEIALDGRDNRLLQCGLARGLPH